MGDAELSFRELVSEHQSLDARLQQFSTLARLTDTQQVEESSIKKRKLALKDRIEAIRRGQMRATA